MRMKSVTTNKRLKRLSASYGKVNCRKVPVYNTVQKSQIDTNGIQIKKFHCTFGTLLQRGQLKYVNSLILYPLQLITLNKINLEILDNKLSWSRVQPKYARLDSNVNNSGMKVVELTGA